MFTLRLMRYSQSIKQVALYSVALYVVCENPRPGGECRGEEKRETEAIMNKHETTEAARGYCVGVTICGER